MRRVVLSIAGVILLLLFNYLFIRSHEFSVRFKAKTTSGDLIETVRFWNRSLKDAEIVQVDSFYRIEQRVSRNGNNYKFIWDLKETGDSTINVRIKISEPGNGLRNKVLVPITQQPIETDSEELVRQFYEALQEHLEITRVKILGEAETGDLSCVCKEVKTDQIAKGNGMMREFPLLSSFIADFHLEVKGPPLVRINAWDHSAGTITFDFCFPVVPETEMPDTDMFEYKIIPGQKALRAEYFGNYFTSDRAWYLLINYAKSNGYDVENLPVEYFHNNPNLGTNEREWRAEIFLPIK